MLRLSTSTLYDSNGEMSEYLIVPLAKRHDQLAISKSLPTRTAAPSPREAKAGIVAHLRIDLADGFAAVVTVDLQSRPCLRAFVRGTPFQLRVWRALLRVSAGSLTMYGRLSAPIQSTAGRARCWKRRWRKSDRVHHSLSPRDPRDRRARQLSLGAAPQTRHHWLGSRDAGIRRRSGF